MNDKIPEPAPMTPGIYITKRREAAGLTVDQISLIVSGARPGADAAAVHSDRADVRNQILMIERDEAPDILPVLGRLAGAFRFDMFVYCGLVWQRVDADAPVPPICKICACSWNDACDDGRSFCHWVTVPEGERPLCSACARKESANAA